METRGSVAWTDPVDGRYNLCVSSQEPWGVKETVSEACGVSSHDLRVVTGDVGGGFGMKGQVYPEDILVLHASILTGHPVKWTADRTEAISTDTHGRGPISNGQLALDQEGKILAFRTDVDVDVGDENIPCFTLSSSVLDGGVCRESKSCPLSVIGPNRLLIICIQKLGRRSVRRK